MWLDKYTTTKLALEYTLSLADQWGATDRQKLVLRCLIKEATRFHLVYTYGGIFQTECPWEDDTSTPCNSGLPEWYFAGGFTAFEVDLAKDKIEWWPEMGPAPHWTAKFSEFHTTDNIWSEFSKWWKKTY